MGVLDLSLPMIQQTVAIMSFPLASRLCGSLISSTDLAVESGSPYGWNLPQQTMSLGSISMETPMATVGVSDYTPVPLLTIDSEYDHLGLSDQQH